MVLPAKKRTVSMRCPNCKAPRTRRYSEHRLVKIHRVKCRECGKFAPWEKWGFDNPTGLNLH